MSELERVHWFLREVCNLKRCEYCFGPLTEGKADPDKDVELAELMVQNHIKEVILGGGEPLLAGNLENILQILKHGNIRVSLHTNGLLLTEEKLNNLQGLIDDIALPIDAVDKRIQREFRDEGFMKVFERIMSLGDKITSRGIGLGWHTVFTSKNCNEITAIYRQISKQNFNYWRIYEYNPDLARQAWLDAKWLSDEKRIDGILKAERLITVGTPEKGGTDSLLADFLRTEEKMSRSGDSRITFVARLDCKKEPYAFLLNSGDMNYYAWYSDSHRRVLGNIFKDGFAKIDGNWGKIRDGDEFDEEDWLETTSNTPLWVRLVDGGYFIEEWDEVRPRYRKEVERLAELWEKRKEE